MISIETGDDEVIKKISKGKEKMRKTQKKLYKAHMARVKKRLQCRAYRRLCSDTAQSGQNN